MYIMYSVWIQDDIKNRCKAALVKNLNRRMADVTIPFCSMHYNLNCCSLRVEYTMTKSMDAAIGDLLECKFALGGFCFSKHSACVYVTKRDSTPSMCINQYMCTWSIETILHKYHR